MIEIDTYETTTHAERVAMRDAVETMMSEYTMSIRCVLLAIADECDAACHSEMIAVAHNAAIALREFANDPRIRDA